MKAPFWVYTAGLQSPTYAGSVDKLLYILSGLDGSNRALDIINGNSNYRISSQVASAMANAVLREEIITLCILGESWPIGSPEEVLSVLYRIKTERLYRDGEVIRSSGDTIDTALR